MARVFVNGQIKEREVKPYTFKEFRKAVKEIVLGTD